MEIRSEYVELKVSDGTTMQAWTARPIDGGSLPGLLVFQEAFGVNAHIRDVTQRFAREGFIAIAPELFHRTGPGFEGSYDAFPTTVPHMNALKDDQMEADERAAFDWLTAQGVTEGRIGAIGYCMGGRAAFLAGLTLPIGCATSYYGGGIAPQRQQPRAAHARKRSPLPGPALLGRQRQAPHPGPGSRRPRHPQRRRQKLHQRRILRRRPRFLLRRTRIVQPHRRSRSLAVDARVSAPSHRPGGRRHPLKVESLRIT